MNVYLKPSGLASRFTRHTRAAIEQGKGPAFDCAFVKKERATKARKAPAGGTSVSASKKCEKEKEKEKGKGKEKATPRTGGGTSNSASASASKSRGKRKREASVESSVSSLRTKDEDEDEDEGPDEAAWCREMADFNVSEDEDVESISDSDMEWQTSLMGRGRGRDSGRVSKPKDPEPVLKRARQSLPSSSRAHLAASMSSSKTPPGKEVIEISD